MFVGAVLVEEAPAEALVEGLAEALVEEALVGEPLVEVEATMPGLILERDAIAELVSDERKREVMFPVTGNVLVERDRTGIGENAYVVVIAK